VVAVSDRFTHLERLLFPAVSVFTYAAKASDPVPAKAKGSWLSAHDARNAVRTSAKPWQRRNPELQDPLLFTLRVASTDPSQKSFTYDDRSFAILFATTDFVTCDAVTTW